MNRSSRRPRSKSGSVVCGAVVAVLDELDSCDASFMAAWGSRNWLASNVAGIGMACLRALELEGDRACSFSSAGFCVVVFCAAVASAMCCECWLHSGLAHSLVLHNVKRGARITDLGLCLG